MIFNNTKTILFATLLLLLVIGLLSCDNKTNESIKSTSAEEIAKAISKMTPAQRVAYDKALDMIEKAKEDDATHLDLNLLGLSQLPPEIGQLKSLKSLFLYRNNLTSLPVEISNLNSLEKLYIHDNKIKVLPEWITEMDMEIVWGNGGLYLGNGIYLRGNPLEEPPVEIVKKGKTAIKAYFNGEAWVEPAVETADKMTPAQHVAYDKALSLIETVIVKQNETILLEN
ncbi:MAG: hypothetical protein JEZ07_14945 [Phycisphaerae bacterium]|nr:hypothetical protein [Phycisphaerae bacterium]